MWQLERAGDTRPSRARTISTASSSRSSYAFISEPEHSTDLFSSSVVSVERTDADSEPDSNSEPDVHSPAFSSPGRGSGSGSGSGSGGGSGPGSGVGGNVPLPRIESLSSSISSVDSLQLGESRSGRLLTLHIEKTEPAIWPVLISGPAPVALAQPAPAPAHTAEQSEALFNADPTSLGLLGLDCLDVRKDKDLAFEYFLCGDIRHIASV